MDVLAANTLELLPDFQLHYLKWYQLEGQKHYYQMALLSENHRSIPQARAKRVEEETTEQEQVVGVAQTGTKPEGPHLAAQVFSCHPG